MIEIRPAHQDERDGLVLLGQHLERGLLHRAQFPPLDIAHLVEQLLARQDDAAVFVACEAGALVGAVAVVAVHHFVTSASYADVVAWWVEPDHRGGPAACALLDTAEAWAVECQLPFIRACTPIPSRVGRLCTRRGYVALEMVHFKALAHDKAGQVS